MLAALAADARLVAIAIATALSAVERMDRQIGTGEAAWLGARGTPLGLARVGATRIARTGLETGTAVVRVARKVDASIATAGEGGRACALAVDALFVVSA